MENASEHPRVFVRDPGKDCPPSTEPWCGYMLDKVSCQFDSTQGSRCRLTRKLLQAGKQIPDLALLDFTNIRHEVCDIAS